MSKYIIPASRVTLSTAFTFALLSGLISAQESDTARAVTRTQTVAAAPVAAVSAVSSSTKMSRALNWAIRNAKGDRYVYGATGPNTWDCSGLVQRAYRAAGVKLPRTTYDMIKSRKLKRVTRSYAFSHRGTLAFHGNGHVELVSSSKYKYGARRSGTRVGFTSWYDKNGWKFYALR